jgi:MFS transporter, FSR family, fosmidomycin resistance protein
LIGGAREAAWPLIRAEFSLNYVQIGLIMSLPAVIADLVEPSIGILSDVWRRRTLILAGGILFGVSLLLMASSRHFWLLLFSTVLFFPASGSFVNVSQVSLMDSQPLKREQNMARWTFAGSLGMAAGPLLLGASSWAGAGWRGAFLLSAACALALTVRITRSRFPPEPSAHAGAEVGLWPSFLEGARGALSALRRGEVLRWLALLKASDLMLDVLFGFLALYFVDVVGVSTGIAALAVTAWTVAGLLGDMLVIPLLERVRALPWLRASAAATIVVFPAFLLAAPLGIKLALLGGLGISKSGWYASLEARLYASLPGRGGTALALGNVAGLAGGLLPLGLGALAEAFGLQVMMWFLVAGPIALLVFLPREKIEKPIA